MNMMMMYNQILDDIQFFNASTDLEYDAVIDARVYEFDEINCGVSQ